MMNEEIRRDFVGGAAAAVGAAAVFAAVYGVYLLGHKVAGMVANRKTTKTQSDERQRATGTA